MASRKIPVRNIIEDLQKDLGDVPIMEKYYISPEELQEVKRRWIEDEQLSESWCTASQIISRKELRSLPRCQPLYEIKIFDAKNSRMVGSINDIHAKGLQVEGIVVMMDEVKTFVIPGGPYNVHQKLAFKAQCLWSSINELGTCVAGFRITEISPQSARDLEKLIATLTIVCP